MPGFTTMDDGSWEFSFDDTPEVPDLPVHDPFVQQGPTAPGYLEGPGKWENYTDDVVYELESMLRKFFEEKLDDPNWKSSKVYWKKYTCGLMFEQLYGRKADMRSKDDLTRLRRMPKLLAYYSTKIQREGIIRGKKYTKKIYHLSTRLYRTKPPYNLKVRLEWLAEKGEMPCWQNMRLPKDDLTAGHARNPKTDENMRIRRERAKQRYSDRKH